MNGMTHKVTLHNGVEMPFMMIGTPLFGYKDLPDGRKLWPKMSKAIEYALSLGSIGIDTARDYGSEPLLGQFFSDKLSDTTLKRDDFFVTTKVGNSQQLSLDMEKELEKSLDNLKLDYIDLWLLHWPFPDYYLKNWEQMCRIYESGRVRAIGIANLCVRHLCQIESAGLPLPMVCQVEYHPFNTITDFREMCRKHNIQLEAYSSTCVMLPFVRTNPFLLSLAEKYAKSVAQIILRWHVQQGVIPIFQSFNPQHIEENSNVLDFSLTEDEMNAVFALNADYKYHPESINCPGY